VDSSCAHGRALAASIRIRWPAERISASEEGLWSMELTNEKVMI
jgi:hypothetical protein